MFGSIGATLFVLSVFLYLSHSKMSEYSEVDPSTIPGHIIANSRPIRLACFLLANIFIAACAVFGVVSSILLFGLVSRKPLNRFCSQINYEDNMPTEFLANFSSNITDMPPLLLNSVAASQSAATAPVYLFSSALSLASISAFLKAGCVLKFIAMIICIGSQVMVLWSCNLFKAYQYEGQYV